MHDNIKTIRVELTRDQKIDELLEMHNDIKSMIELQKQVLSTMHIIFTIGNAFKWLASIAAAFYGIYYLLKTGNHLNRE